MKHWGAIQMTYKGYMGDLEVDEEAGELFGVVLGLRDVVTFVGSTVEEARKSFEESIDVYLRSCAESGKDPDKPFSGKLLIRIPPTIHRHLALIARARKASLNDVIVASLGDFAEANRTGDPDAELELEPHEAPKQVAASHRRRQA